LRLSCYIHRNPLRAGIVARLAEYPWSSYKAYAYGSTGWDRGVMKDDKISLRFRKKVS